MNKKTTCLVIVIMALSFVLGVSIQSKAQSRSFTSVIPFMTSSDRLGFFDQSNGRIYMYDNNFNQNTFEGQLQELGQPIQVISKSQ